MWSLRSSHSAEIQIWTEAVWYKDRSWSRAVVEVLLQTAVELLESNQNGSVYWGESQENFTNQPTTEEAALKWLDSAQLT